MGNYVRSWILLTFEDTFGIGKLFYTNKKTMTFMKVDE